MRLAQLSQSHTAQLCEGHSVSGNCFGIILSALRFLISFSFLLFALRFPLRIRLHWLLERHPQRRQRQRCRRRRRRRELKNLPLTFAPAAG